MFCKLIGANPTEVREGVFSPSKLALKMAVEKTTDFKAIQFQKSADPKSQKILVIGTEEDLLEMKNGKDFLTGNHPVETFLPILHFQNAGLGIDIATPTGKAMKIEEWALPYEDKAVMDLFGKLKSQMDAPLSLNRIMENPENLSKYVGIFIPGGHGAVIDLPTNKDVGSAINWTMENNKFLISICHGPAAFLAARSQNERYPLEGYQIAAFPDSLDKILPPTGYLPGKMPWYFGEKLNELGVKIVNKSANGAVEIDRKVITGDSPKAANKLGQVAAEAILNSL